MGFIDDLMIALIAPMDVRISYAKPEDEASTEETAPTGEADKYVCTARRRQR